MRLLGDLLLTVLVAAGISMPTATALGQDNSKNEPAKLKVYLPANAVLHVDGAQTQATGEIRNFLSPPLPLGRKFVYTLRASWKEDGKEIDRERTVRVEATQETIVDFRAPVPTVEQGDKKIPDPAFPFVPMSADVIDKMLELAEVKKSDVVYDPRCGDGRVLIKAAQKFGVRGLGFDSDPQRVNDAIENAKKSGVANLVAIKKLDISDQDFKDATVVALRLSPEWNVRLMPQLAKLKPGSRIVSDDFDMKGAKPTKKMTFSAKDDKVGAGKDHTLYLWAVPWQKE